MGSKHKKAMPGHGRGVFGAPLFCSVYGPQVGRLRYSYATAYGGEGRGVEGERWI